MKHYKDKVAVITGAGSGIGRALARQLALSGCHLALSDVNAQGLEETVALMDKGDIRLVHHRVDVTDRAAVKAYAAELESEFGAIDLLFNNAGIAGKHAPMQDYEYSDFEKVLDVNLWGTICCTKEMLPLLLRAGEPQLVNFSSILGLVAVARNGAYTASKFAVRGYTEALQLEFADSHLHVSCVHPGFIATNIAVAANASAEMIETFKIRGMSPDHCARIILKSVAKRRRRIVVTPLAHALDYLQRVAPSGYRRIAAPILSNH